MLPIQVPDDLARLPQWIYWQAEVTANDKLTKVPYQVDNWTRLAASTRPEEWSTFADAKRNFASANRSGTGFVFQAGGNIFGIDVDSIDKVAPADQEASMRLRALIHEHFQTYCEVSPSGTGRHYIGFGSLPEDFKSIKDSKYGIEVYDKERFFTFTGEVLDGRNELTDCGDALLDLAHTMRGAAEAARTVHLETDSRTIEEIYATVSGWTNGAEFIRLMSDPLTTTLSRYKQDHSSADLALTNYIATATKDADKAVELFRSSPLWREGGKGGYIPEQKYIDDYLLRLCFGKVWGENAVKEKLRDAMVAEGKAASDAIQEKAASVASAEGEGDATSFARQFGVDLPHLDASRTDCPMPPGIAGDFIRSIYESCYTPVPEFSVAVGMAFLSGVTGRAYRFQNNGLNAFFMVGAKSSTGKTQSINALQRLLSTLDNPQISERLYAISGKTVQGLHPYFEKAPAGAWITDECGAQVKALVEPTGQSDHELKDAINSLFDAAIPGKRWTPPASRTSAKEDKSITCLSAGIGWFTTREKIYSALNNNEIADGFLSRFVPVFYNKPMGEDNYNLRTEFPDHVKRTIATMWAIIQENDVKMPMEGVANTTGSVKVEITDDAKEALHQFSYAARNITRRAQNDHDILPDAFIAMSRVGVIAQRLAAVCAVMENPVAPVIQIEEIKWAIQLVGSRMLHVLELMATGEVGSGDSIEVPTIVRVMKRLIAQNGRRVPMAYMHDKLRQVNPFKDARIGPMNAVKQALNNMLDEGRLVKVVDTDGVQGRPGTYYMITGDLIWK
jgi:hypothetical protein